MGGTPAFKEVLCVNLRTGELRSSIRWLPEGVELDYKSLLEWDPWYFYGYSTKKPERIDLSLDYFQVLLSAAGIAAVLGWQAPMDPRYLINKKGTTAGGDSPIQ